MAIPSFADILLQTGVYPYKIREELLPGGGGGGAGGVHVLDPGSLYLTVRLENVVNDEGAYTVIPPGYNYAQLLYQEVNVTSGSLTMSLVYDSGSIALSDLKQDISSFAGQAVRFTFGTMPLTLSGVFLIRFSLNANLDEEGVIYCPVHLDWDRQINLGFFVVPPYYDNVKLVLAASGGGVVDSVVMKNADDTSQLTLTGDYQPAINFVGHKVLFEANVSGGYTTADFLVAFTRYA